MPAIADGHVTILRVNPKVVYPEYLADYLRAGFGADQIRRLHTGSTGLIELTPGHVDAIVVDLLSGIREQKRMSKRLRASELAHRRLLNEAEDKLSAARSVFREETARVVIKPDTN